MYYLYVAENKTKCPLTRGVCLREVSAYERCPLAEVRLYSFVCIQIYPTGLVQGNIFF